jgi:hypothetical protein
MAWQYNDRRSPTHGLDLSGCILGCVDFGLFYIFNKSTPENCYIPSKSTENSKKKFFDPVTASSLVTTFWVIYYIRVQNFLFTIWTSWVSKDAEFM